MRTLGWRLTGRSRSSPYALVAHLPGIGQVRMNNTRLAIDMAQYWNVCEVQASVAQAKPCFALIMYGLDLDSNPSPTLRGDASSLLTPTM